MIKFRSCVKTRRKSDILAAICPTNMVELALKVKPSDQTCQLIAQSNWHVNSVAAFVQEAGIFLTPFERVADVLYAQVPSKMLVTVMLWDCSRKYLQLCFFFKLWGCFSSDEKILVIKCFLRARPSQCKIRKHNLGTLLFFFFSIITQNARNKCSKGWWRRK